MPSDVRAILSLEVPLIVLLGERMMRVSEVCALGPGAIVELPKGAEEELTLLVNNKAVGAGQAVKVGENFGIKISYIGDLKARIAALGGEASGADGTDGARSGQGFGGAAGAGGGGGAGTDDLASLAESMLAG